MGLTLAALTPWLWGLGLTQAVLGILQVVIVVAGIVRAAYPVVRPVALVAFIFTFSWLTVAPIYQLSHNAPAWGDFSIFISRDANFALVLNVLASAAMYTGFFFARRQARGITPARTAVPGRALPALFLVAGCALLPVAVASNGGLGALFTSRTARGEQLEAQGLTLAEAGGAAVAFVSLLPAALGVAATYLLLLRLRAQVREHGFGGASALDTVLCMTGLALAILFANPFISTRAVTATAFVPLILLLLQPRSGRAGISLALALLFGTLIAYPLANQFRGDTVEYEGGLGALSSIDFDGYQQVINSVTYADDIGHSWGNYSFSAAFFLVPRSIWEDKATPASIDVAAHRGYVFTNLSLPFHAEMYVEFGAIGMVLCVFGAAWLGGRCDRAWLAAPGSLAGSVAPYVAIAVLMIIRGPLGAQVPVYLTTLGLILLGLLAADQKSVSVRPEMYRSP